MDIAQLRSTFINVRNTQELNETLAEKLPSVDFKIVDVQGSVKKFKASVMVRISDVQQFMKLYNEKTNETLRISSTKKNLSKNNIYREMVYLRCHFKTRYQGTMNGNKIKKQNPSKRFRNTECPFTLALKFKSDETIHLNCDLEMEWNHNHPTKSLQALSYQDIHKTTRTNIFDLFDKGFTPGLAYREIWRLAKEACSDETELHKYVSNRSHFPRRTDYNQLYTEYHRMKFGTKDMESMFDILNSIVENLQIEEPDSIIQFQKFNASEGDPFILVIITSLMLRVHKTIQNSGELVFIDSSGGMEEFDLRVFVIVTHSFVGALPLGIIVTSDETTETLTRAFEMYSSLLPAYAFHSSPFGPGIIMTDNCDELYDALHAVWPNAKLLLCLFHIMQQVWRWLFDKNHVILQVDRPEIMCMFRKIVYATDEDSFETFVTEINELYGEKYKNLKAYLKTVFAYKERWCLLYRRGLLTRGNNTNNFVESQFLVLKDNILCRTKEININGLIQKLVIEFMDHYKVKLLGVANGRYDGIYSKRLFKGESKDKKTAIGFKLPPVAELEIVEQKIVTRADDLYVVPSFTNPELSYLVDMNIGLCACEVGQNGTPCKHQYIIWTRIGKSQNFIPYLDTENRKQCSYIAIGKVLEDELYESIHQPVQSGFEERAGDISLDNSLGLDAKAILETERNADKQVDARRSVEHTSFMDGEQAVNDISRLFSEVLEDNKTNTQLIQGILKFRNRLEKYKKQTSKLTSSLHSFGGVTHYRKMTSQLNTKLTKKTSGKIKVQVEAAKRRVKANGSRTAVVKGMNKKNNPFNKDVAPSRKRKHKLSQNVENNEQVPKKAGRTMGSKTKFLSKKNKENNL
ncbi:uncharacterized protein [Clytia hemisphaerica]|uniref:uncharacterized protein n=1 Tax=Clytia hemisphaerica TaxID=252671 RepID=UPI0034D4D873